MTRIAFQLAAGLILTSLTSGCSGLAQLSSATTPTELFTLTPKSTFSPSLPQLNEQIVVLEPTATAAVDTDRIAVQPTPLQVQYLPGAGWVDRAPVIVQTLLIESFENTGRVPAVGNSAIGLRADYIVVPNIREFQGKVMADQDGAPLVVDVRLNIKLLDADFDRIIGSNSFEAKVTSASDAPRDVAQAFDEALGRTMRNAVEWSIRQIARHAAGG